MGWLYENKLTSTAGRKKDKRTKDIQKILGPKYRATPQIPHYQCHASWACRDCRVQWCQSRLVPAFFARERLALHWWWLIAPGERLLGRRGSSPRSKLKRPRNGSLALVPSLDILHFCTCLCHNQIGTRRRLYLMFTKPHPLTPLHIPVFAQIRHRYSMGVWALQIYNIVCPGEHDLIVHRWTCFIHLGGWCYKDAPCVAAHKGILDGMDTIMEGWWICLHFRCRQRCSASQSKSPMGTYIVGKTIVCGTLIRHCRGLVAPGIINWSPWRQAASSVCAQEPQCVVRVCEAILYQRHVIWFEGASHKQDQITNEMA